MKKPKTTFPYQVHLILGFIWIFIGVIIMSGVESMFWILIGIIFIIIGFLAKKDKSKKQ